MSTSNTNIKITPNGTGKVVLDGLSYPTADGTNGQALVTDGSGTLSFTTIQASELTTVGSVFSNYNEIATNTTITTASNKNMFLMGEITVVSPTLFTIAGTGTFTIL